MKAPFSCTTRCFCMVLWVGVEWEGTGEKAPQLASTPASCSKQAAQLSPGAAPPALCLLVFRPWLFLMMEEGCRTSCCLLLFGPWDGLVKGEEI